MLVPATGKRGGTVSVRSRSGGDLGARESKPSSRRRRRKSRPRPGAAPGASTVRELRQPCAGSCCRRVYRFRPFAPT
jgi:hypothetical protein